jgi:hypothetical protein
MDQTSDGGYVVAGYSNSDVTGGGDVSETNNGSFDYWIVKLDSGGGIEWERLLGGSGTERAESIAQTSDGGYIVAGISTSSASGDVSDGNHGSGDYWIVKLDGGGNIEWERLLGGSEIEWARSIKQSSGGDHIVAGYSESSASGDVSETNHGLGDYWIIILNKLGKLLK